MQTSLIAVAMTPVVGGRALGVWPFVLIGIAVALVVAIVIVNNKSKK